MGVLASWNNSALADLAKCGIRFKRKWLDGERVPGGLRQKAGTSVHDVSRQAHKRQLAAKEAAGIGPLVTREQLERMDAPSARRYLEVVQRLQVVLRDSLPSTQEARDLAATAFDAEVERGVLYDADERAMGEAVARGRARDHAIALAAFYMQTAAPGVNPVGVERRITIEPEGIDLKIHGTMDLIDDRGPEGEIIRDLKTTAKSPNQRGADDSLQLSMYAMLRLAEVGRLPSKLVLDTLVRTPGGDMKLVVLETTRTQQDVQVVINRINAGVEAANRGVFFPADPAVAWWCSPKFCEFWRTCSFVNGTRERNT